MHDQGEVQSWSSQRTRDQARDTDYFDMASRFFWRGNRKHITHILRASTHNCPQARFPWLTTTRTWRSYTFPTSPSRSAPLPVDPSHDA
jgi:hypothetical protein